MLFKFNAFYGVKLVRKTKTVYLANKLASSCDNLKLINTWYIVCLIRTQLEM